MTPEAKAKALDAIAATLDVPPEMALEAVQSHADYMDHLQAEVVEIRAEVEASNAAMEAMVMALISDVSDAPARNGQSAKEFKQALIKKMQQRLSPDADEDGEG